MKNIKIVLIGLFLVIAAAGWVYLSQQDLAPKTAEAPATTSAAETVVPAELTLRQKFENLLNEFLHAVATKSQEYRKERRVLADLVKPENLRTPEYVDQNYELMKTTIPALHLKIDELMLIFEDTETKVNTLLADQPPEVRDGISKEWQEMKTQQATTYVSFFEIEEKILAALEELMTVYYTKKGAYTYDEVQQKIVFTNPEDEAPVQEIRARLADLVQQEAELVSPKE